MSSRRATTSLLTATTMSGDEEYFSHTSELQPALSEGVYLHTSEVTGMLWCDMSDLHLAHDPNTPISALCQKRSFHDTLAGALAEEREMQGIPHMLSRTERSADLEVCIAHGIAQGLRGCCISIKTPAQTPVSKLCNGDKCTSLALLCNSVLPMISLVGLPNANKRNHTGCDTEAQGNRHTNKIHCRNQHLHRWAWCTAMCVTIFPLSILALLIFS